jgi:hypothetical protein
MVSSSTDSTKVRYPHKTVFILLLVFPPISDYLVSVHTFPALLLGLRLPTGNPSVREDITYTLMNRLNFLSLRKQ